MKFKDIYKNYQKQKFGEDYILLKKAKEAVGRSIYGGYAVDNSEVEDEMNKILGDKNGTNS